MGDFLDKKGKKLLIVLVFAVGLFWGLKYLFPLAAPFILALLIVYLNDPWLKKVQKKTHIRKEILLGGILLLAAVILLAGVWGVFSWGTVHAADLGDSITGIQEKMDGALHDCCIFLEQKFGINAMRTENLILEKMTLLTKDFQDDMLPKAAKQSWTYLKQIGGAAAFLGVGFISSLLLCKDYESILKNMGENHLFKMCWEFLEKMVSMVGGYLKAQAVILLIISVIAVTCLLIGRVSGAWILGILAGLLDALPFIGTGIVLIPTALWQLLERNVAGAALAVLAYVLCIAARELLEPRLMGKQMGIYPVLMLFGVYAGVRLFGLSGIFLGPLYVVLLKEGVNKAGKIC